MTGNTIYRRDGNRLYVVDGAQSFEIPCGARGLRAEREILACHDSRQGEPVMQHVADEVLGGKGRHCPVEGQHDGPVEARRCKQVQSLRYRRQRQGRRVRLEQASGVRIEGDNE